MIAIQLWLRYLWYTVTTKVRLDYVHPSLKKYWLLNLELAEVQNGKICDRFLGGSKLRDFKRHIGWEQILIMYLLCYLFSFRKMKSFGTVVFYQRVNRKTYYNDTLCYRLRVWVGCFIYFKVTPVFF